MESVILLIIIQLSLHLNKLPDDLGAQIAKHQDLISNDFLTNVDHRLGTILQQLKITEGFTHAFIVLVVIINVIIDLNGQNNYWQSASNLNIIHNTINLGEILIILNALNYNLSNFRLKHFVKKHIH